MLSLTFYFLFLRNKNTKNIFLKGNVFLNLLKIIYACHHVFILSMSSTENTKNEILLFPIFGYFRKIFLSKMKTKI